MNGFAEFLGDSKVHDTVLVTMIVSSFLAAIRRIKVVTKWWQLIWNFFYDWAVGFWSMKTGQPLYPATEGHFESSTQTPDGTTTQEATFTSEPNPTPPANPAPTK